MSRFNLPLINAAASIARRSIQRAHASARRHRMAVACAVLGTGATMAMATGTDFSSISGAVDWSAVGTGILAIAALKAVPLVVSVGSKMVLRAIGR